MNIIKNFVTIFCILFLAGCSKSAQEAREIKQAKNIVSELQSIRHENSGLCFAYAWGGPSEGGPVLSEVPCYKEFNNVDDYNTKRAKVLVDSLKFVKHEKSGLCFAYGWAGSSKGGPALTQVSCDKVEKFLK